MSTATLQDIIRDFSVDKFIDFFREKSSDFAEDQDVFTQYDDERFMAFNKLGQMIFPDGRKLLVLSTRIAGDLSERSSKKAQYEKAKKILKDNPDNDAGIFIFYDDEARFRFSLVYEQVTGTKKTFNNYRRYTYFISEEQTNKTFLDRIGKGDFSSLASIKDAFSVEKVNKEFYNHIARFFYRLTGKDNHKREMALPSIRDDDKKTYQEFAVRLIGRTIFCWFLKHKRSASGLSLIPESILSSKAAKVNSLYYHSVLEKLFFEILNKTQDQRIKSILPEANAIPFLNGGLFEPHNNDFYESSLVNALKIPDDWFEQFLEILEQYNFTIDENSTVDADVSVDPEMLGRIFENLLAEVNPETGETARKATGSYYTPRTIVDYMVDQSCNAPRLSSRN
jgi:adenine-specific DNA-methyltransferase